mmetsp:Transcript_14972/g.30985  ORF Transcript_14972/g.30985 Transcript_14972/m.30985 type:complete len:208 (+) Transcript_14972:2529-3152(+)
MYVSIIRTGTAYCNTIIILLKQIREAGTGTYHAYKRACSARSPFPRTLLPTCRSVPFRSIHLAPCTVACTVACTYVSLALTKKVHALHDLPSSSRVLLAGSPLPLIILMTSFPTMPPSTAQTGATCATPAVSKSLSSSSVRATRSFCKNSETISLAQAISASVSLALPLLLPLPLLLLLLSPNQCPVCCWCSISARYMTHVGGGPFL